MVALRPPLTTSSGYPVVRYVWSSRYLAFVFAGKRTVATAAGKPAGSAGPSDLRTAPRRSGFSSSGGVVRGVSIQLLAPRASFPAAPPAEMAAGQAESSKSGFCHPQG